MDLRRLEKKLDFSAGAAGRNQGNLTVQVYPFFPQNVFRRYLKNGWSLVKFEYTVVFGRLGRTLMNGGSMDLRRLEKKLRRTCHLCKSKRFTDDLLALVPTYIM